MIAIYDFGSQYSQLIARRVRELGFYSELLPPRAPVPPKTKAIVLSGGPGSVLEGGPLPREEVLSGRWPVLGICYGLQAMVHMLGGQVERSETREYGPATLEVLEPEPLFAGLPRKMRVWMSHGDRARRLPSGFITLARTEASPHAAIGNPKAGLWALQFHPEVAHTERGQEILANFLTRAAGLSPDWSLEGWLEETIAQIRETVGDQGVVLGLSGGVDSSVLAWLLREAIRERLYPVFVDTGLLRAGEAERVRRLFSGFPNLRVVDASRRFLAALRGVSDPEEKRKRIGHTFIQVFKEATRDLPVRFLAQGTLYPDVIESGPVVGPSARIKSHHNVGGLPAELPFELLEPFRFLFKDEVRKVGQLLGVPREILTRHPFPGPGLAVRIVGPVTPEDLDTLRRTDRIVEEEIREAGLYESLWQAFAVLLPVRTVGVMGDRRTYERVVVIRAVVSQDGMTADWARLPYRVLERLSARIINEVPGVNRVAYDITSKPPGTIEWE